MTSPTPLEYGGFYHIWNRGNNRENIFFEERNYHHFLRLYGKHVAPIADTYAYCLLRNHFHLLVRTLTPEEQTERRKTLRVSENPKGLESVLKPSRQFGNLFNAYAKAINKAYDRTGSLFENPFGREPVTSESYLVHLVAYIHQNPQKHGFVADFRDWPFSSYHAMLSEKPTRLERGEVLAWFQGVAGFEQAHRGIGNEGGIAHLIADDFD